MATRRQSSGTLEAPQDGEPKQPAPVTTPVLPALPKEKTKPSGRLDDKTILIYGPPGVGKSTLASEFDDALFFDVEGGLKDLEVYSVPITDWREFLSYCAAVAEADKKPRTLVIDTIDALSIYTSAYILRRLGIAHESDEGFGKAWKMVADELRRPLNKLAAMPNIGLILISHAKDIEVRGRNKVTRWVPSLTGQIRDLIVNMTDITLYVDFADENRVVYTKPTEYWEAKERGMNPRLPAEIAWPFGESGYSILVKEWKKGGGK